MVCFFASLMAVLYHLGVMQRLVSGMARLMRWTMGVSGAEALSGAGNVFVGITHRLDRPASGVVLFTRTSKALARVNRQFREQRVEKIYWAAVDELPPLPSATLVHYLRRNPERNKSYAFDEPRADGQEARLSYRLLLSLERYHLLGRAATILIMLAIAILIAWLLLKEPLTLFKLSGGALILAGVWLAMRGEGKPA